MTSRGSEEERMRIALLVWSLYTKKCCKVLHVKRSEKEAKRDKKEAKLKRALALESEGGAERELGGRLDGGTVGAGVIRGSPYSIS